MKRHYRWSAIVILALLISFAVYYLSYIKGTGRTLLVGGSSTVLHYTKALADVYMEKNKNTDIIYESGGSTPGLIALKNGSIDIASMSRDLADSEDDEFTKNYLIGKDAIGIVVHPSNPIENLTVEQIRGIFTGEIDNWMDLSGQDAPIRVVIRAVGSTTFKGLDEMVLRGSDSPRTAVVAETPEQMAEAVAGDPGSIGFLALKDLRDSVKPVKINGVEMTRETILTDRYPLSRSFYYVVYDISAYDGAVKGQSMLNKLTSLFRVDDEAVVRIRRDTILDFLTFVKSPEGQTIIEQQGAISVY